VITKKKYKKKRLPRKITKEVSVFLHTNCLSVLIPSTVSRNLNIEKGDKMRLITDRKRHLQYFKIIKKEEVSVL